MDLVEYLNPLRRWWWLLVIGTAVAVGASYYALGRQPPAYQARTTLMIGHTLSDPNPNYSQMYLVEQLSNTYADLAQRAPVRRAAMDSLGIGWLPGYSVALVPNTDLLQITVTSSDPQLAQAAADAIGAALVAQSPANSKDSETQRRQEFVKAELNDLEVGIKDTRDEIARMQGALAGMLSAREIADTQSQISAQRSKLSDLQANYAALLSNTAQGAANTLSVVEPAELPRFPVSSSKTRTLGLVGAVGLIMSAATAYLLSYLDDTLKTPAEIKRTLGLTTLAVVPEAAKSSDSQALLMREGQHSVASEAYRVLRTNLQFASVDRPLRTLLVTSGAPAEGKSLISSNLAIALAQAGSRVVLVDTDLHRPTLHRLFRLPNSFGLTNALLADGPAVNELLRSTSDPRLRVLTSGPLPPNPTELLGSAHMRSLLAALARDADVVVLDSPPVVLLADAAVLSTLADGVLVVVAAGVIRRRAAEKTIETLNAVNARLVGALLNRAPPRGPDAFYYQSYYRHYGYYTEGEGRRRRLLDRLRIGRRRPGRSDAAPGAAPDVRTST